MASQVMLQVCVPVLVYFAYGSARRAQEVHMSGAVSSTIMKRKILVDLNYMYTITYPLLGHPYRDLPAIHTGVTWHCTNGILRFRITPTSQNALTRRCDRARQPPMCLPFDPPSSAILLPMGVWYNCSYVWPMNESAKRPARIYRETS